MNFDTTQLYLRPVDFVDAPQTAVRMARPLAGGMMWFAGVELWFASADRTTQTRRYVALADWEAALAGLPPAQAERAAALFANLTSPRPALTLGARTVRLDSPQVMGIVNCTPDSFSDGGKHDDPDAAIAAGGAMAAAGAAVLDIGGESTRPGAALVWEGDEIARIEPVVRAMALAGHALSVDTRKGAVMSAALTAGAHMINDISGLLYDDQAPAIALASGAPVCIMHAPSQSSDPHKGGDYADVVLDVFDWLEMRVEALTAIGIPRAKIVVDPGIGFGKSLADNLTLMTNLAVFHGLGCAVLVGVSRKRMIGALSGEAAAEARLGGSIQLATHAMMQGANILRVHDVAETVQAAAVFRGLRDAALTAKPIEAV
jgi:dihydropteroate synthase